MIKHTTTNIGIKLKQLRENANLTQKQIAEYLSVDQSLVSKIEKSERSISSDILNQLSALYCCPVSLLISNEDLSSTFTIAFRTTSIDSTDLQALAIINKIALNQLKMDQIAGGNEDDR